jgi:hypothetical protein
MLARPMIEFACAVSVFVCDAAIPVAAQSFVGATIVVPERRSSEYLQRFVESEIAKNAAPIKAAGISMD